MVFHGVVSSTKRSFGRFHRHSGKLQEHFRGFKECFKTYQCVSVDFKVF